MGKLTNIGSRVSMLPPRVQVPVKRVEGFYTSPEWRGLVKRIKQTRGNWCEDCGSGHRVIGDHIVERKDGGADLDESNIKLRCFTCHQRKTAKARAMRAQGQVYGKDRVGGDKTSQPRRR